MPGKIDYKVEYKSLYAPSAKTVSMVEVPPMNFLMIDGAGNPNHAPEYGEAVNALYAVAYAIKFAVKKQLGTDYTVMPLEGLWWAEDMDTFITRAKEEWQWTMMVMQPDIVTSEIVQRCIEETAKKKDLPALPKLRFALYEEGSAAQILYVGSYDDETETIANLHRTIEEKGYALHGKHHEIYLNDPRRVAPEKLKTVIRQPFRKQLIVDS
jgi:hypothetical protein